MVREYLPLCPVRTSQALDDNKKNQRQNNLKALKMQCQMLSCLTVLFMVLVTVSVCLLWVLCCCCAHSYSHKTLQVGQDFKDHQFQPLNILGEEEQAGQGWQWKYNTANLKIPFNPGSGISQLKYSISVQLKYEVDLEEKKLLAKILFYSKQVFC